MAATTAARRTTGARPDPTAVNRRPVRAAIDGVAIVGVVVVCAGIAVERTGVGEESRKENSRGNSSNPPRKRNRSKKIIERSVTFRDV